MDLHLAAPVAEPARRRRDALRHGRVGEQAPVELRRGDAGEHGTLGADDLAAGEAHARRFAVRHEDPRHLRLGAELAARLAHDRREALDQADTAALRHRHPAELERAGDHLRHEAGGRLVGPEARVQD
ncbi:MAG TPA: hypothetical protein VNT23_06550, partial [Gaiellaceae bacterium]|nr:hypothetical protein [Gaiellaceae bacterium]